MIECNTGLDCEDCPGCETQLEPVGGFMDEEADES